MKTQGGKLPKRANPASGVHIRLDQSNIVLLTISTEQRVSWLASETVQAFLEEVWSEATAWLVGDYLLMPDHLHCFCAPHDIEYPIEPWIAYWKRVFRQKHNRNDWIFQSRGWHHRLRNGESYSEKWLYVQENPIRKQFCQHIEDWKFKGKVFDLLWTGN